jgi:hypothetical protein
MPQLEFPKRVYTFDEVRKAKELIDKGYKHDLTVEGSKSFKQKVKNALQLVKIADHYDFLRTYIRQIVEIDGLTQLRNADVTIWANKYTVENPVDAASVFIQKANVMKEYLELKHYYSGEAEKRAVGKRIGFLETLRRKSTEKEIIAECERLLSLWREGSLAY